MRAISRVLSLLGLLSIGGAVLATEEQGVTFVSPKVYSVRTFWGWKEGDRTGFYRVIMDHLGYEHVSSRVYLQWVEEPLGPDQDPRVISERKIEEISDGLWSVGEPSPGPERPIVRLRFEATHVYSMEEAVWTVKPTEVGTYVISRGVAVGGESSERPD